MKWYLGIDVSKGYADFCLLDEQLREVTAPFQLDDEFEGHAGLYRFLAEKTGEIEGLEIYVAVESTGGYENNWYATLKRFGGLLPVKVARLNPAGVKYHSEAVHSRVKSDQTSARWIAEYQAKYPEQVRYEYDETLLPIRRQWGAIRLFKKQRQQLVNNLHQVLYDANPELLVHCKTGIRDHLLRVIEEYPTAKKLARAHMRKLAALPQVSEFFAHQLIENAKRSVAADQSTVTEQLVVTLVQQIRNLDEVIERSLQAILREYRPPEIDLLITIPGIGELSALGLLMEIGPVERFPSAKQLAAYCGIHPQYKESGDSRGHVRMSKKGRKEPRRILFINAFNAVRFDPYLKTYYERHLANGKSKLCATGIVMHKLLRIVYGILKSGQPYSPEIDRINSEKKKPATQPELPNTRRYQPYADNAPISKRAAKKRRQPMSKGEDKSPCTGSTAAISENKRILQPVNCATDFYTEKT